MIPTSVLIGGGLWLACAVTLELARAGAAGAPVALVFDGTLATLDLLALGAVTVVALRAHTASTDEVRRVVVFSAGFLLYLACRPPTTWPRRSRPGTGCPISAGRRRSC